MGLKFKPGFKQFLIKTGIFVILFIALSLIIGQRIVNSSLLYGFNIFIYGGMGYVLLFCIAGFVLVYRERLLKLDKVGHKIGDYALVGLAIALAIGFYVLELNIDSISVNWGNTVLIHIFFLSIFIALLLGIYGLTFLRRFVKEFKREIAYFLGFGIIVYVLMYQVWKLWPYFSLMVLKTVAFLSELFTSSIQITPPFTLRVGGFAAQIGEACSGVYSIFIFTAIYLLIIFLDWDKLNKKRALAMFIPAVIGAFLVNILRVWGLFIAGAYFSTELALGLYHSYTGMILFLIYFGIFWYFAYKYIKVKKEAKKESWIKTKYKAFMSDSLYRNSAYLMLATLIMSFFGFIFWIVAARLFPVEEIGLATTIISVMGIITSFSVLGLNTGIIRFLPKSERKNDKINTVFTLVAIATIIVSVIFLLGIKFFSPKLIFIQESIFLSIFFIIFMAVGSIASMLDSIFTAYRSSGFVLLKNSIFSVLKIALLAGFVGVGAYGIFASWMISLMIGALVVFLALMFKFNYKPKAVFYDAVLKKMGGYSFGNYIAAFIGGLPALVLPLIITQHIGAEETAYYYIALMIATALYVIPQATANSLFAEGSHDENSLKKQVKKATKVISLLIIPAIILTAIIGRYVLMIFGETYASEGTALLQILALSGIFVSVNSVYNALQKVRKNILTLILAPTVTAAVIISLSILWIDRGLVWIGLAWIIGQAVTTGVYYFTYTNRKR